MVVIRTSPELEYKDNPVLKVFRLIAVINVTAFHTALFSGLINTQPGDFLV